ncbi:MAG TPA: hypothetical protein VH092_35440 [Urbifossiella sp.]|nr:hypothetical protein [Urbifossiella sp.]
MFGEILLVRYLLDPPPAALTARWPTLFPGADPAVVALGRYLTLFWTVSLVALWGFKLFSRDVWDGDVVVWPLAVGLVLGVAAVAGGVRVAVRRGWPRPPAGGPLHQLAGAAVVLFAAALAAIYAAHTAGAVLPPFAVVCVLLGLANAGYGFLADRYPGSQYVAVVVLIGLGILLNSRAVNRNNEYKLTLPGLEEYYASPLRLDEEPKDKDERLDHYYRLLAERAPGQPGAPDLIPGAAPLEGMKARWREKETAAARTDEERRRAAGAKPRIVIVCTSGGGIRAAVWTAVVLEGLERELPGLRDHIRMVTGASGDMVGAGLYAANFENGPVVQPTDPRSELGPLSKVLAADSLRRTVQTMVLVDQPTLFWPGRVAWDRGREIERVWAENTAGLGDGKHFTGSPFSRTLADLAPLERAGRRPSLVYSPMLVEDARRLLISNLDLWDLTWTYGNIAGFKSFRVHDHVPAGPDAPLLSISAAELFRLFPAARDRFAVGTAARLNASFPLVSPGVSLPTNPPRRVVDAGYYDNFGVDLAAMWLLRNEAAIREHTSGVAVVEIRAYRNGYARWHFQDEEDGRKKPDPTQGENQKPRRDRDALTAALEWISTPVEAIGTARSRAAYYRNDELLDQLDRHFTAAAGKDFFTTLAFECEVDAALSWTLSSREARRIARAYYGDPDAPDENHQKADWIRKRVKALHEWFGSGGR